MLIYTTQDQSGNAKLAKKPPEEQEIEGIEGNIEHALFSVQLKGVSPFSRIIFLLL